MRDRGKAVELFTTNLSDNFNYSAASEISCKKHPNSSSVGICAFCLKDRLVKLVCSECGEQRLSSCSCSDASSSYRNSCSTVEIGSVGRVSFLIENEKSDHQIIDQKPKRVPKPEQVIFLRRSRSSCVEVKKSNGFWKIKRLFRKKRKENITGCDKNGDYSDDKSEIWVRDVMGVSRSRSLCSFRGGRHNDLDEGSECAFSSAKISDVTSGGVFLDSDKQWGYEFEQRKSGFRGVFNGENGFDFRGGRRVGGGHNNLVEVDRVLPNRSVFPAKESDFSAMDESAFIDLKLDLSTSEMKELSAARVSRASDNGGVYKGEGGFGNGGTPANLRNSGVLGNSGSCRITVNEKGLKRGGRSHKVWKWIFKYNPANKREENNTVRS